ncbi:hypothetical protein DV738_g4696, partial [Chaetothyriales sp. CBS 135597]
MNSYDTDFYRRTTNLKNKNPALKVFIAVGGWDAGGKVFSDMARTASSRKTFIDSAISMMNSYAFDGIDIDWEYPLAPDRGGAEDDFENFTTFMRELKAACGSKYGLTLTLPSSYWYMQGFDVAALQDHVDWFQFMSYDIHGTWDGSSPWTRPVVAPHTNLTEISQGLDLLWRNNVNPGKVVLGLGFYGRSFTLKDSSCNKPGCAFSSGAKAGACTKTSGVLSNAEIQRIIKDKDLTPVLDRQAGIKYINWDGDQWVSYDDAETLKMKKDLANKLCLGGTMVWALDQEDKESRASSQHLLGSDLKYPDEVGDGTEPFYQNRAMSYHLQRDYGIAIFWTECQPYQRPVCPVGYYPLAYGHGKVYDADFGHVVADGCHGGGHGWNRALCAPMGLKGESCGWHGKAKKCNSQCPKGFYRISQNSHIAFEKTGCQTGRYANFCCKDLISYDLSTCVNEPGTVAQLLSGGTSSGGFDKRGFNFFKPQPCDIVNLHRAYLQNHPGWIGAGVEGHFEMRGNTAVWQPAPTLQNTNRPPQSTRQLRAVTTTIAFQRTTTSLVTRVCDGSRTTQACHHYSSVLRRAPQWAILTCPSKAPSGRRPAPIKWNNEHNSKWSISWIPKHLDCERDEFPFFRFFGPELGSWIRLIPSRDNSAGGNLANNICPEEWQTATGTNIQGGPVICIGNRCTTTVYRTDSVTVRALSLRFTNCNQPDDAIPINPCNPTRLTDDRGFALLTRDPWYEVSANRGHNKAAYRHPPAYTLTVGKSPVARRDWIPEELVVDMGNSSRRATEQEIFEKYGLVRCAHPDCAEEAMELGLSFTVPPMEDQTATETRANAYTTAESATGTIRSQSTFTAVAKPKMVVTDGAGAASPTTSRPSIPLSTSPTVVEGGTRGLGLALVQYFASKPETTVCGRDIARQLKKDTALSIVFISAGIFQLETFEEPKWDVEVATYTTSAIAPPFIVSELYKGQNVASGAKIVLISSEAGSFALQSVGGGGNYAHHASKSAVNMVGLQLKYDLEPKGIIIAMVHPSFMRTEMTKGVGFDVAYEENDALTPDQAAKLLADWTEQDLDITKTGQFWAPRGSRDIGTWKQATGRDHVQGPVQLPW